MKTTKTMFSQCLLASVLFLGLGAEARAVESAYQYIVGTPACPQLNAHQNKACKFKYQGHDFQVWPGRIAIKQNQGYKTITGVGHNDGMFDHVLGRRRDDHISFSCYTGKKARYVGPFNFKIDRGGVWRSYGPAIVTVSAAITSYLTGENPVKIAEYAEIVGNLLSKKFGNNSWENAAGNLAIEICSQVASQNSN